MPRVLNKVTGLEHIVPAGHFSLTDADYEVLADAAPGQAEAEPLAEKPKPAPRARQPRKK